VLQDVLDAVEFGVVLGVGGLLPRLGALEGDAASGEQAAQGLAADADLPIRDGVQVAGEFADRPAGEGLAQTGRSRLGRRDDEVLVVRTEQAGTASRPLRVQRGQADLVEAVDHIAHRVLVRSHELGDDRDPVPAGRGQQHHRPPVAHRTRTAPAHDPL
jgi:hypothetical protein